MVLSKKAKEKSIRKRLNILKKSPLCSDICFHVMIENSNCAEAIIRRIPGMGELDLSVVKIWTEVELVPFVNKRYYRPDSLIKAISRKTGKIIYINIEMQNSKEGSQLERTRLYHEAVKMYLAKSGTSWNDFPEVITVMFTNHIPAGNNLLYYEDGLFGEGASKNDSKELIPCGKPRVIYISKKLDKTRDLLEKRPELKPVAEVVHDLQEVKSCNMMITELREFKNDLEEVHMTEIGNDYPIDRLVNRLLRANTRSVTKSVTDSLTTEVAQNMYREGIDIPTISTCLNISENEVKILCNQIS